MATPMSLARWKPGRSSKAKFAEKSLKRDKAAALKKGQKFHKSEVYGEGEVWERESGHRALPGQQKKESPQNGQECLSAATFPTCQRAAGQARPGPSQSALGFQGVDRARKLRQPPGLSST